MAMADAVSHLIPGLCMASYGENHMRSNERRYSKICSSKDIMACER